MTAPNLDQLVTALRRRESLAAEAINRLRELAPDDMENEVYDLTVRLNEAIALMSCLRHLVAGRSVAELHAAFGAPGDFGYETPLGDALARLYRGEAR